MKKILIVLSATVTLASITASAQMGKNQGQRDKNMMGTQQSSQIMSGQMMTQQKIRDMSGMLGQMNSLMHNMSSTMDQDRTMDRTRIHDMSKLMDDMSITMKEMSGQMENGSVNPAEMKRIQDRMKSMNQMMDNLRKTDK